MKTAMLLISLIASLSKVSHGFEIPCNASNSTMKIVQFCPLDEQTYVESAKKKNCLAIPNNCKSFEYHCLPNRHRTALIEVCAPSLNIIGRVCGIYHEGFNSIRRTEIPCPTCPYSYNSTDQFKNHVCYELLTSSTGPYNTASQELSSSQPVSPGTINNETKDISSPDILTESKENVTKNGLQPTITVYTQSPRELGYVFIAALGLAFMGSILFIIVDKIRKKECSRSKTDVEANISPDDFPDLRAPLLSEEVQVEIQQTGQGKVATSSPDSTEMSDRDQTHPPNTPDCMDKSVSSQTSFNEQQPTSPMSNEQPTAEASESETLNSRTDIQANIYSDINPACPDLSEEVQVEIQQTGQGKVATSSPDSTEMSDRDQTHPPNTPDCMDKSVSSQTSFNEQQPTSPMSNEQSTSEANESETLNSRTDIQANISTDINPVGSGFLEEVKLETQRKGQRSMATFSTDCTEMSDTDQTPNTPDCMDKSVSLQRSFNERQPSSIMSSEQPTGEAKVSDVSNLCTEMSIDDHSEDQGQSDIAGFVHERQELSDKEQTLPLNASDCMDNPSCIDQPYSATSRGQPTDETIGSCQSKSFPAVRLFEARIDNVTNPKAIDDFENQHFVVNLHTAQKTPIMQRSMSKASFEERTGHSNSLLENVSLQSLQLVPSKDFISTQETNATEDSDNNQQSEASMIRKTPDKRLISVEDNTNQNPVNTGPKKSKLAINVFGNSADNANFSIYIDPDPSHFDIPLSTSISQENKNQRPSPKEDTKAMKKKCVAELDDADQEPFFFHNQQGRENMDLNFLLGENGELKEEISKLRERENIIERREKNMAERESLMAEREKMMKDRERKQGKQIHHR